MKKLLSDWHFARILQLVLGLSAAAYGLYIHDNTYFFIAAILLLQAVFNISLCGMAGCSTTPQKTSEPVVKVEEYRPKR